MENPVGIETNSPSSQPKTSPFAGVLAAAFQFVGLSIAGIFLTFTGLICFQEERDGVDEAFVGGAALFSLLGPILAFLVFGLMTRKWRRFIAQSLSWFVLLVMLVVTTMLTRFT